MLTIIIDRMRASYETLEATTRKKKKKNDFSKKSLGEKMGTRLVIKGNEETICATKAQPR